MMLTILRNEMHAQKEKWKKSTCQWASDDDKDKEQYDDDIVHDNDEDDDTDKWNVQK